MSLYRYETPIHKNKKGEGMMAPIELADRLEINDLLVRYCHVLDDRDWAAFTALFTDDAMIDFSAFGGPRCRAPQMTEFLRAVAVQMPGWQHTISTVLLTAVDGSVDAVRSRCAAQVMMIARNSDDSDSIAFNGLWYRDLLVRTAQGWKFRERTQERSWTYNSPVG
jgi:3-phenylpropionate/cinnamic acid dioxygenase small subunit